MRNLFSILAVAALALALAPPATAQNPHYVRGPTFTTNADGSVTAAGSIAGLGNQNVTITLEARVRAQTICTNPGGNVAPGQTRETTLTGSVSDLRPENGRVNFQITTGGLPALNAAEVCPNARWSASYGTVTILSATLTVYQRNRIVLQDTFNP